MKLLIILASLVIVWLTINKIIYKVTFYLQRKTIEEIIELCFYCVYGGIIGGILGIITGLIIYIYMSFQGKGISGESLKQGINFIGFLLIFGLLFAIGGIIFNGEKYLDKGGK